MNTACATEVGARRRDEPVDEREPALLHPRGHARAEHEPGERAQRQHDRQARCRRDCRPPSVQRARTGSANTRHTAAPARMACPVEARSTAGRAHGQSTAPNGESRPSLPGLRMPCGSSACFTAASTTNAGPSASRDEAAAVQADAVVVRQVAAVGQHGPLSGVPQRDVGRLDLVRRGRGGEREVQARAVGVAVRQVAGGGPRVRHRQQRDARTRRRRWPARSTARRSRACRPRNPCGSAPAARWCRCGGASTARPARDRARRPTTHCSATIGMVASTIAWSPSSSTSSTHCVPSPSWPRWLSAAS